MGVWVGGGCGCGCVGVCMVCCVWCVCACVHGMCLVCVCEREGRKRGKKEIGIKLIQRRYKVALIIIHKINISFLRLHIDSLSGSSIPYQ